MSIKNVPTEELLKGRKGEVYDILSKNPNGMTTDNLLAIMDCTRASLYSAVNLLNKGSTEFSIISRGGKYYLKEGKTKAIVNRIVENNDTTNNRESLFNAKTIAQLKNLPPSDIQDVLDMMKKSYYYKKSAESLIEANKLIGLLMEQLNY